MMVLLVDSPGGLLCGTLVAAVFFCGDTSVDLNTVQVNSMGYCVADHTYLCRAPFWYGVVMLVVNCCQDGDARVCQWSLPDLVFLLHVSGLHKIGKWLLDVVFLLHVSVLLW